MKPTRSASSSFARSVGRGVAGRSPRETASRRRAAYLAASASPREKSPPPRNPQLRATVLTVPPGASAIGGSASSLLPAAANARTSAVMPAMYEPSPPASTMASGHLAREILGGRVELGHRVRLDHANVGPARAQHVEERVRRPWSAPAVARVGSRWRRRAPVDPASGAHGLRARSLGPMLLAAATTPTFPAVGKRATSRSMRHSVLVRLCWLVVTSVASRRAFVRKSRLSRRRERRFRAAPRRDRRQARPRKALELARRRASRGPSRRASS